MLIAAADKDEEIGRIETKKTAPDMLLALILLGGMAVASILWGLMLQSKSFVSSLRGSMEYTTIMMMDLKHGRRYKYVKISKDIKEESTEDLMRREAHQLKVEAGLAG